MRKFYQRETYLHVDMPRQKGFIALTELIVVLSVAGILIGLAIPAYHFARQRAREAAAISVMGDWIKPACEQFKLDVGSYPIDSYGQDKGYGLLANPFSPGTRENAKWRGPYLQRGGVALPTWLTDPWGVNYRIVGTGLTLCMVVSAGRNKEWDAALNPANRPNQTTGRFGNTDDLGVMVEGDYAE